VASSNLGTILTNKNCSHKETKSLLSSGTAPYHAVQNLSSPSLLSENIKITIQNYNFARLYWCETGYLTLRKKHRPRVINNTVLMKIFGPKMQEIIRALEEIT
jgi:hypothetical protein